MFLLFSLSIQLNRYWGHHVGVMPVTITQLPVEIGIFYTRFSRVSKSRSALLLCSYCTIAFYFVCCKALTLFICGEVELNSWPKNTKSCYYFSLCHWNLSSLLAHEFSKLSLIEAYNTHHNFEMICLSETYLDSSYAITIHDLTLKTSLWLEQIILLIVREVELVFILKIIWLFARKSSKFKWMSCTGN